jgi:plasmid stabilization system protein ParE
MSDYIVSPQAQEDIFSIWCYLAKYASIETANKVEGAITEGFQALAQSPAKGHRRAELTSHPVLFYQVYSYLIVYRRTAPIEIVRVLHGRRNIPLLLGSIS